MNTERKQKFQKTNVSNQSRLASNVSLGVSGSTTTTGLQSSTLGSESGVMTSGLTYERVPSSEMESSEMKTSDWKPSLQSSTLSSGSGMTSSGMNTERMASSGMTTSDWKGSTVTSEMQNLSFESGSSTKFVEQPIVENIIERTYVEHRNQPHITEFHQQPVYEIHQKPIIENTTQQTQFRRMGGGTTREDIYHDQGFALPPKPTTRQHTTEQYEAQVNQAPTVDVQTQQSLHIIDQPRVTEVINKPVVEIRESNLERVIHERPIVHVVRDATVTTSSTQQAPTEALYTTAPLMASTTSAPITTRTVPMAQPRALNVTTTETVYEEKGGKSYPISGGTSYTSTVPATGMTGGTYASTGMTGETFENVGYTSAPNVARESFIGAQQPLMKESFISGAPVTGFADSNLTSSGAGLTEMTGSRLAGTGTGFIPPTTGVSSLGQQQQQQQFLSNAATLPSGTHLGSYVEKEVIGRSTSKQ